MNLQEEYFIRNGIDLPFVKMNSHLSHLILQDDSKENICDKFEIWTLSIRNRDNGPNYYELITSTPVSNGLKNKTILLPTSKNILEYDSLYDFFLNFVRTQPARSLPVLNIEEVKMACWDMFSYSCDYVLADMPYSLMKFNYDYFNETNIRKKCILIDSMLKIGSQNRAFTSAWALYNPYFNINTYAFWAGDVFLKQRN